MALGGRPTDFDFFGAVVVFFFQPDGTDDDFFGAAFWVGRTRGTFKLAAHNWGAGATAPGAPAVGAAGVKVQSTEIM